MILVDGYITGKILEFIKTEAWWQQYISGTTSYFYLFIADVGTKLLELKL
jgi:hypothetical protein